MIPPLRLELKEGSAADPAEITLMLSAPSYGFTITYNISVEPMFRGRISPPSQVFVPEENSSVVSLMAYNYLQRSLHHHLLQDIFVTGDNEALTPSYNLTVNVQPTNDYAGEGAIEVTITDDDCKYMSIKQDYTVGRLHCVCMSIFLKLRVHRLFIHYSAVHSGLLTTFSISIRNQILFIWFS